MPNPINLTGLKQHAAWADENNAEMNIPPFVALALIDTAEAAIAYTSDVATWKEHDRLRETLTRYTTTEYAPEHDSPSPP